MFKKTMYKYKDNSERVIISPNKPDVEYEIMYRLIATSEDYVITNYIDYVQVIDVKEKDLGDWVEMHKDDLDHPISQNEEVMNKIEELKVLNNEQDMLIIENAVQIAIIQLMM